MERLVVISGLSGSGKSLAAKCLEDLGFFCVDNLPVSLIPPFCELLRRDAAGLPQAALVVDVREGVFLKPFPEMFSSLRKSKIPIQLLFFDCSDEVLKRRYSETRRPHPMSAPDETLESALARERAMLQPLRELADRIIDTSKFTSHQLRAFLSNAYSTSQAHGAPNVNIVSFGFKYGAPTEADLLFDVRFLPNPYFVEGLRHKTGLDPDVQAFLDDIPLTGEFLEKLQAFLEFLVPHYADEGKSYLTIAIGCTGGKHRSVALTERIAAALSRDDAPVTVSHRDLGKE